MAKILTICAAAVSIILLGGCQSTSYVNQPSSPLQVITKAELTPNVEVDGKIEAKATVCKLFWLFTFGPGKFAEGVNYCSNLPENSVSGSFWGNTINEAKAAAAYKACIENKADFIICPRYFVTTNNYLFVRTTTAKVLGYKGVLTGVEKAVPLTPKATVQSVKLTQPIQMQIDHPIKVVVQGDNSKSVRTLPDSSEK